jgi:LmbE family N-acetylglucosaminyl deacetylase
MVSENNAMAASKFSPLQPQIVLGIAAHPDDLDFGAAGTLAGWAAAGAQVHYLLLTDGGKGSSDRAMSSTQLVTIRQAEQRAAVAAIGGASIEFLAYPDGELEVTQELKKAIVKTIRSLKPDVVITMDPAMLYSAARGFINHPDHRAAGQAALDAVFPLARDHLAFPELLAAGLEPHQTKTVLLVNFDNSNFHVNIAPTIDTKMAALAAHTSQMSDLANTQLWVRDLAALAGQSSGYQYAESFIRIDVR